MPVYVVRMKDDNEIVGIYSADNENDLAEFVDESVTPMECEYLVLPDGGFYLDGGAQPIPRDVGEDEEVEFFAKSSFTDSWDRIFLGTDPDDGAADHNWRALPFTPTSVAAAQLGLD
jgi:hypothetical protein